MSTTLSSLVATPVLWRVLVAAAAVGARIMLDDVVPRGHVVRCAMPRWARRG
jgi:hypothetical protein